MPTSHPSYGFARSLPRVLALVALAFGCLAADRCLSAPLPEERPGRPGETAIGVWLGGGWYDNAQFNARLVAKGIDPIESGFEYGVVVRHRMSRWVSLGVDLMRLDGRTTLPNGAEYGIVGSPFVINGYVHPLDLRVADVSLFAGVGLLVGGAVRLATPIGSIEGKQTGFYTHAGAEVEGRIGPNLAFALRGVVRRAKAENIDLRDVTGDPTALFDVEFNGAAIHFGPRWYFGGVSRAP